MSLPSSNSTSQAGASSGVPLIVIPAFDNTLGALLVGGMVAMALWGVTCVQTFTFFTRRSKDLPVFKLLIAFLLVLDTFDTVLNCHFLYFYLVKNYLNPLAIVAPVWSVIIHVAVTSISDFIIRSMFARRIYRLSRHNIFLTAGIVALSFTDLICGLIITAKAFGVTSYLDLDPLSSLMYLNFAAGTSSDLSVALVLCYLLRRSRTGFQQTDSLITILMVYTVNTGLLVALDASAGLITYIVMPHNLIFLGFYLLMSKLYLNSYLASLNAREGIRGKIHEPMSIHLSKISGGQSDRYDLEKSGSVPTLTALEREKQADPSETAIGISVHTTRTVTSSDGREELYHSEPVSLE